MHGTIKVARNNKYYNFIYEVNKWRFPKHCVVQKIHVPYSPLRRDWKFQEDWGTSKAQKFTRKYGAKLKFPEGCVCEWVFSLGEG